MKILSIVCSLFIFILQILRNNLKTQEQKNRNMLAICLLGEHLLVVVKDIYKILSLSLSQKKPTQNLDF